MKKILIFGLGSAGQRHLRNLKSLKDYQIEIACFRSRNLKILISENMNAEFDIDVNEYYHIKSFNQIEEAFEWIPDAVIIANPISMHIETALQAVKNNASVFIEKPLGSSLLKLNELKSLLRSKNLVGMVGYQMRYHPGVRKIKELILSNSLGQLISGDFHFGEWLPGMHPYEDYRDSHASRKDQGGGVVNCLSHEVDLAYWLFGYPRSIYAIGGHLSSLELNVEDTSDILMQCNLDSKNFPVHIHLDFIQKPPKRYINIVGEKGNLFLDLISNELILNSEGSSSSKSFHYKDFNRNDMFLEEIKEFVECLHNKKNTSIPIDDGECVLKICLDILDSMKENTKF